MVISVVEHIAGIRLGCLGQILVGLCRLVLRKSINSHKNDISDGYGCDRRTCWKMRPEKYRRLWPLAQPLRCLQLPRRFLSFRIAAVSDQ
eukprot:2208151-Amphidinium_carterae.2